MKNLLSLLVIIYASLSNASVEVTIDQFENLNESAFGPGAREHSLSWVHDSKYYLFGGHSFSPTQGTASTELWSLNLKTKFWKLLPQIGELPSANSRLTKIPGKNSAIVISYLPVRFGAQNISQLFRVKIQDGVGHWEKLSPTAESEDESKWVGEFTFRNSHLSSLVYNTNKGELYSVCSSENCDAFKIIIKDSTFRVQKITVEGDAPQARVGYAYAFSQSLNSLIIANGQSLKENGVFFNDIWSLDFRLEIPKWKKLNMTLPGRRNSCFGLLVSKNAMIVWGGTSDGVNSIPEVNIVDLENEKLESKNSILSKFARSSCFSTYDENNHKLFTGFGNTSNNGDLVTFRDLWIFE